MISYITQKPGSPSLVMCLSTDAKPATGWNYWLLAETDTGALFKWEADAWVQIVSGGGTAWGAITGTLSNQSDLQAALDAKLSSVAAAWPVGSVFTSVVSTNPATLLGFGTWAAFAAGRVLVGIDAGQTEFDVVKETGGVKTVTLTAAQSGLPQHTHTQDAHSHNIAHVRDATTGGATTNIAKTVDTSSTAGTSTSTATATAVNQNAGPTAAAEAHTNLQPYIVVYFWERTA